MKLLPCLLAVLGITSVMSVSASPWQSWPTINGTIFWEECYDDDDNLYLRSTEDSYEIYVTQAGSLRLYNSGSTAIACSMGYTAVGEDGYRYVGGNFDVTLNVAPGTVTLYVTGRDEGVTGPYAIHVDFKPGTVAPTVTASRSPSGGRIGAAITFSGSATDADGQVVAYEWDFDDDGITDAIGASVVRTFSSGGYYYPRLNVRDNDEAVGTAVLNLQIYDSSYNNLGIENGNVPWAEPPIYMRPWEWTYPVAAPPPGYVFTYWSVVSGAGSFSSAASTNPCFTMGSSGDTVIRANIAPDTTPPTAPASLTVTGIGSRWAVLSYSGSSDNLGVTGYELLVNGTVVGSSSTNTATVSGLNASTPYQFTVRARDFAGNRSAVSAVVSATTRANDGPISSQVFTSPGNYVIGAGTGGLVIKAWGAGGGGGANSPGGAGAYFTEYYSTNGSGGQTLGIHPGTGGQANGAGGGSTLAWRQNMYDPLSQYVTCPGGIGGAGGGGGGAAGTAITFGGSIVIVGGGGGGGAAANGNGGMAGMAPLPGIAAGPGSAAGDGGPGYNNSGGSSGKHVVESIYISRPSYYYNGGWVPAWTYSGLATVLHGGDRGRGNGTDSEQNFVGDGYDGTAAGFGPSYGSFTSGWIVDSGGSGGGAGSGVYGGGGGGGGAAGGGGGGGGDTEGGGGGGGGGASLFSGTASYVSMARGGGQEPPFANDPAYPGSAIGRGGNPGANGGNGAVAIFAYGTGPAPTMNALGPQTVLQGQPIFLPVNATNVTDTPIMYSAAVLPTGLTINPSTGVITGAPTVAGTYASTIRAATPYGFDEKAVTWSVTDNSGPSKPDGLVASNVTSGSLTLGWNASFDNVGVTGYEVKLDDVSLGVANALTRAIPTTLNGSQHKLEVRARDAAGNWSQWSNAFWMQPYTVSLTGGTPASTTGYPGITFDITAGQPPSGYFAGWTISGHGSIDRPAAPQAKFTIGEGNAMLGTTHADGFQILPTITATVDAGGGQPGRAVTIRALPFAYPNYSFLCWELTGPGYITDVYAPVTQAVMGAGFMLVNAIYAYDPAPKPPFVAMGATTNVSSGQPFSVSNTGICYGDYFQWQQTDHSIDGGLTWTSGTTPNGRWDGTSTWSGTFSYHALVPMDPYAFTLQGMVLFRGRAGKSNGQYSPFVYTLSRVGLSGTLSNVPSNLRVTGVTSDTLMLAWDVPVAGIYSYEVFKTLVRTPDGPVNQPGSTQVNIWNTASTAATLWGLVPGNTYRFKVRQIDWAQNVSNWSNEVEAGPPAPPVITQQPVSQTAFVGQSVSFVVMAVSNSGAITYQWQRNGTAVNGATSATLTLANVQPIVAGAYTVTLTNTAGSTLSTTADLAVLGRPVITSQPISLVVNVGQPATFSVVATGIAPLTYQWRKDDVPIAGATTSTYSLPSVQAADAGSYRVAVTNADGTTVSRSALLTLQPAPLAQLSTNKSASQFIANWSPYIGATSYRLDVSTDINFGSYVGNYHDLTVNGVAYNVTGLSGTSTYYYRVRAVTSTGMTANSNVIIVWPRGVPSANATESAWYDFPIWVGQDPRYDGLPDEIISARDWRGLLTYIYEWRYTGGTVVFDDYSYPVNDYWWLSDSWEKDDPERAYEAFKFYWHDTFYLSYPGVFMFRVAAEFMPEVAPAPGYYYAIYSSKSDIIDPALMELVAYAGNLDGSARAILQPMSPEYTAAELDDRTFYLVRYGLAPSGCVIGLPGLNGSVIVGSSGSVNGAISLPGNVKVTAGSGSATITFPSGGGTVTIDSNGNVSGSWPSGYGVTAGLGQATLAMPVGTVTVTAGAGQVTIGTSGGVAITAGGNSINLTVPQGVAASIGNAIDGFGKWLGIGDNSNVRINVPSSAGGSGGWEPAGSVNLGSLSVGTHTVGVTSDTRGVPESQNIVTLTLTILPPPQYPLDLDVNNSTTLGDAVDGIVNYLPGYEGTPQGGFTRRLSTGQTFSVSGYIGQCMTLVLQGMGTQSLNDEVTFEITSVSSWDGFCMNAVAASGTDDYSFQQDRDEKSITINRSSTATTTYGGRMESDRTWARFWCKDYGGKCVVVAKVRKDGQVVYTSAPVTIPVDTDSDNIADLYEKLQVQAWRAQYSVTAPSEGDLAFFDANSDKENIDPDGSGALTNHKTAGDGLTAFDEYRGFITDNGPSHTGGHTRLSFAKKELLVEASEMAGIAAAIAAGNNPAVTYSFASMCQIVTDFYRHPTRGAGIDVYWAKDEIVLGDPVDYNGDGILNGDDRPNAYYWLGSVRKDGTTPPLIVNGGAFIWRDDKLFYENPGEFEKRYWDSPTDPAVSVRRQFKNNRNPRLEHFVKLLLISRLGRVFRDAQTLSPFCTVVRIGPAESRPHEPVYELEGCLVAVTGLAEEGLHMPGDVHYDNAEFSNVLDWAAAHELGHIAIVASEHPGVAPTALMTMPPGPGRAGISVVQMEAAETAEFDLKNRASVP